MPSEVSRPGGPTRPARRRVDARPHCDGVLIVYAAGEGCCARGHECQVYGVRWSNHDAYLAAHHLYASPGDHILR